jgi:alkylation response protein AidB-like acyl-CoA dehydrogenase
MRPDELGHRLRERLDALGPARRAELLHVLMLPDFERADRIDRIWEGTSEIQRNIVADQLAKRGVRMLSG